MAQETSINTEQQDLGEELVLKEEDKIKIKNLIDYGITITTQINDLRGSLKDQVDAVAGDLKIKPAILNKAIRTAAKSSVNKLQHEVNNVETLLHAAGRA